VTGNTHIIILTASNAKIVREGDTTIGKQEFVKVTIIKGFKFTEWFPILFDIYDIN
jgi:hypothetical protein